MKILKALAMVFYAIAIVLIVLYLFDADGKKVIGILGYSSLVIGGICTFTERLLKYIKAGKKKDDKDTED